MREHASRPRTGSLDGSVSKNESRAATLRQGVEARGRHALAVAEAVPLPGWSTPLAVATLAMLVVQSLDHRYVRGNLTLSLIVSLALALLFVALYSALRSPDWRLMRAKYRPATALLIGILAANTLLHAALAVPHLVQANRYGTDAGAATDCATQMFLRNQNPYANLHMLVCLDKHHLAFNQTTPKSAGNFKKFVTFAAPDPKTIGYQMWLWYGKDLAREQADKHYPYHYAAPEFEDRFNYPGGAILFGMIGWVFGTRDLVTLYLSCAVIASLWIYSQAERRIRRAVGLLLLADLPLFVDSSYGTTDVLYASLLVLYWYVRERALTAGLILGLAAATRQQVWFFLPFLLYLGWRTGGWGDLHRRLWPAVTVFLACNITFIVQSPGDWVSGVLGPMRDPLFAQGVGLVAMAIAVFKQHPGVPLIYTVFEALAFVGLFRLYMRRCLTAPGMAMILPLIPIALGWRSLHTYFVVMPLLAIAVLACPERGAAAGDQAAERPLSPESPTIRLLSLRG